jgi:hypothetical protein
MEHNAANGETVRFTEGGGKEIGRKVSQPSSGRPASRWGARRPGHGAKRRDTGAQRRVDRSDINFDEKVDGADLGQLLADWGDAPRQNIPPSDCPLALINP